MTLFESLATYCVRSYKITYIRFYSKFSVEHPEIYLNYMEFPDQYIDQMIEGDNADTAS